MTDQQALSQYATRRDAEAFRQLVEAHQSLVYAAASRRLAHVHDVEEVVQSTFLKLARSANTIRRDLAAWLYITAVNTANDLIRRDATRRRHEALAAAQQPTPTPLDMQEWQHISLLIDDAILELPARDRQLIVEHFFQGRSQRDLAAGLGLSQATVSRRMEQSVERLRSYLRQRGCAVPAASLAGAMEILSRFPVPPHVSAELVKIGLSGSGAIAGSAAGIAGTIKIAAGVAALLLVSATVMTYYTRWAKAAPAVPLPVATLPADHDAARQALVAEFAAREKLLLPFHATYEITPAAPPADQIPLLKKISRENPISQGFAPLVITEDRYLLSPEFIAGNHRLNRVLRLSGSRGREESFQLRPDGTPDPASLQTEASDGWVAMRLGTNTQDPNDPYPWGEIQPTRWSHIFQLYESEPWFGMLGIGRDTWSKILRESPVLVITPVTYQNQPALRILFQFPYGTHPNNEFVFLDLNHRVLGIQSWTYINVTDDTQRLMQEHLFSDFRPITIQGHSIDIAHRITGTLYAGKADDGHNVPWQLTTCILNDISFGVLITPDQLRLTFPPNVRAWCSSITRRPDGLYPLPRQVKEPEVSAFEKQLRSDLRATKQESGESWEQE